MGHLPSDLDATMSGVIASGGEVVMGAAVEPAQLVELERLEAEELRLDNEMMRLLPHRTDTARPARLTGTGFAHGSADKN